MTTAAELPDEAWRAALDGPGWVETATPGFRRKVLFEDRGSGRVTMLVRIEPGGYSPPHAHELREQVFVLDGGFSDQSATYRKGDFVIREPGFEHIARSAEGALLLVVF